MILALDIGNSQIFGGVFEGEKLLLRFRKTSRGGSSSDEIGVFLRSVLRENGLNSSDISKISMCSVVPEVIYSLRSACIKYFDIDPFILQVGVKTGLQIKYRNPIEVGSDRIANSIAAIHQYPQQNLVIIDLGTATTFCAVSKDREYLGGTIVAGLRLSMEALETNTAKLPSVEITGTKSVLGRSTVESIQSGLFFGHLGTMKLICEKLQSECFAGSRPFIIGTGGFSNLFEKEKIFDVVTPDLVLNGLCLALKMNEKEQL